MQNNHLKKLCYAGVCLTLGLILPFLTGQMRSFGNALSPMHIPVLLCGFLCGWPYALVVGLLLPAMRFFLFGMPPLFPIGAAMTCELATYGLLSGILYHRLPHTTIHIYTSLIAAMFGGRIVWGITMALIAGISDVTFSMQMFLAGAFINSIPGILCHILLIPIIVIALQKAKIITYE
ncbi:MAG: ECF transporter S component [Lachnospiraceae bacterium]